MGKTLNKKRCVILGGQIGEISDIVLNCITQNDYIICADRGYEYAFEHGIEPDLIVGDFDSSKEPQDPPCEVLKLPTHKDDTDLNYAVKVGVKNGFKDFLLTGVTGGRLDHTFASISTLAFVKTLDAQGAIIDKNTIIYIVSDSIQLQRPNYPCYVSVFPYDGVAEGVSIIGAEYPLSDATLDNNFSLGVSNEFADEVIDISVKKGRLLAMIIKK